jgi:hypothetical protein
MAQYGTHHVDIDEKKAELFRRGLSLLLQDRLVKFCDTSFNTLVSVVIAQDGTYQALLEEEEEKRNRDLSEPSDDSTEGAPLKYRLVYTSSAGKSRVPPPPPSPQCDHHPPQQQMLPSCACPGSATEGVISDTCPVSSDCITSCTSAEDYSS